MKSLLLLVSFLFFLGCATDQPSRWSDKKTVLNNPTVPVETHAEPAPILQLSEDGPLIDMVGLQNYLGLTRAHETLGYQDKAFQTCQVGNGFPQNHCQKKHMIVIHFQLMCRDSEGTISRILTVADLQPVSRRPVIWTLKNMSNTVQTDTDGYGQITVIASEPQSQQRLKLTVGNDFLYMRAGEITRVATPPSWCDRSSAQR